jgi:hypothetical protein
MKLECDVMVSLLFVVCATIAWIIIRSKCRASFIDVGRWAYNEKAGGVWFGLYFRWYAFRLSSVILVIGGFMHGHNIIKSVGINYGCNVITNMLLAVLAVAVLMLISRWSDCIHHRPS